MNNSFLGTHLGIRVCSFVSQNQIIQLVEPQLSKNRHSLKGKARKLFLKHEDLCNKLYQGGIQDEVICH